MANRTIYHIETESGVSAVHAFPFGQSLSDWATYGVALSEGSGDDAGTWSGTVDDSNGNEWAIFEQAAQPTWADIKGQVETGFKLAADGLDTISTTAPAGVATNFREMLVQVWRRFFRKTTLSRPTGELKTYDAADVLTTQDATDDGTTQTLGDAE